MTAFVPVAVPNRVPRVDARTTSVGSASSSLLTSMPVRGAARIPLVARQTVASKRRSTVTMVATGEPLEDWLMRVEKDLGKCTRAIFSACKEIAYKIRTASCDKMSCFNDFGDEQLAIDVLADKVIFDNLENSGVVATASSEEVPIEKTLSGNGKFSVAFDPLDGSSIIDTNFSVGTIFGVWPGDRFVGQDGHSIVAAGLAIYGPRTTITLAIDGVDGAHEFLLIDDFSAKHGQWIHTAAFMTVNEGKLFAPGNMRAARDNPGYQKLLDHYFAEKYQLRYTGGMVPDVNQILVKGKGVFCNPASPSAKAKLRVVYEVLPIGYVIEKAGGRSSNGSSSVLDIKIKSMEDRSQVCYGSSNEVARFEEYVGTKLAVEV